MNSRDRLSNLFADLVSESRYEPALAALFDQPSGKWISLRALCSIFPQAVERLNEITLEKSAEPAVAWLSDPLAPARVGYCLIIAYWDAEQAECIALFNKAALEEKLAL
jgi:hypothetical protein